MSVLDELNELETRIRERLAELKPLVDEYEALQRVAERLGVEVNAPPRSKPARSKAGRPARRKQAKRPGSGRRRAGGTQATGRERRERVIGLIKERPGITVPDISAQLGVDAPSLYRVVRKLQSEGIVSKQGKQLRLTS